MINHIQRLVHMICLYYIFQFIHVFQYILFRVFGGGHLVICVNNLEELMNCSCYIGTLNSKILAMRKFGIFPSYLIIYRLMCNFLNLNIARYDMFGTFFCSLGENECSVMLLK